MRRVIFGLFWVGVSLLGGWSCSILATNRGEHISSIYILISALCVYSIGYRFYSKWIAANILTLDDRRATPCEVHDDGKDFVRTNKWIVFGHHFAAISGPGPLVGPVLAAQFGYLPGILWILVGVVLGGAVQDFVILFASMRRDGKSLGEMVKDELSSVAGWVATLAILAILTILLAVLALVVVKALAESPWGVFTVGSTIPIAMFMGGYLRFYRIGKVLEATVLGIALLLMAVYGGKIVYSSEVLSTFFRLKEESLAWAILVYGLAASVLPVWLLLAPRDYLSTFMKLGTIFALVIGICLVLPELKMPALSQFIDGTGPVVAGKIFPFCFITIACGAISGFHALISSGTTPKLLTRENHARIIGYGAMCFESLVATMALIAACTLDPGIYLSINMKGSPDAVIATVQSYGFHATVPEMNALAETIGEQSLFGRTGGAATLAVGMAQIFSRFVHGHGLDLWYHFAIMFEALFILTTIDAGTRVGRYLLQDALGHLWKPLGHTRSIAANLVASFLMVGSWGFFLIQGVRDPLGGINSLWPLFGIANQLLSVVALALATTLILKMQLQAPDPAKQPPAPRNPWYAMITLLPMIWLMCVTLTAGVAKIASPDPRIGFLAQVSVLEKQRPQIDHKISMASLANDSIALAAAKKELRNNHTLCFNQRLDAFVAAIFMLLIILIIGLSAREWILLLARKKLAVLHETPPVWLPEYALAAGKPMNLFHLGALFFALLRELSGEAEMDRLQSCAAVSTVVESQSHKIHSSPDCACAPHQPAEAKSHAYIEMTNRRFQGVRRCC